jgi:hypothetical protein
MTLAHFQFYDDNININTCMKARITSNSDSVKQNRYDLSYTNYVSRYYFPHVWLYQTLKWTQWIQ